AGREPGRQDRAHHRSGHGACLRSAVRRTPGCLSIPGCSPRRSRERGMSDIAPDRFIDNVFAYQKTSAVKAAVELDLFSAIGAGADSVDTLSARVNAAPRGVRILCDYLTVQDLLVKDGGRYRLTPSSSVFLDRRSTACMT